MSRARTTSRIVLGALCVLLGTTSGGRAMAAGVDPLVRTIAAAPAGATVVVPTGVHRVNLRIDKPLTLVGAPGAVLDGGDRGDVVRIAASDVTVRDLDIRRSGSDLTVMNAGIFVERHVHHVSIEHDRLGDVLFGVYLDGPSDVHVLDNRIRGKTALRSPDRGDGIHLWNDTDVVVRGNDIGSTRDGIYIYVSTHSRLVRNHIHDVRYGIHYMYANHNLIEGNVTTRTRAGYALMQSDHLAVIGNHSRGDASYGILMNYVTYSDIEDNDIRAVTGERGASGQAVPGGTGKGLFVYNSEFNTIVGNTIAGCPIGIHVTAGSEGNHVYGNAFERNRVQVKYVQNVAQEWSWHGRGNFWSDYVGWDLDGDGIGDTVFRPNDGVDVLLWKYPGARLLMDSPAVLMLRYVQRAFPVFVPPGLRDSHPLMRAPAGTAREEPRYAIRH